MMASEQLSRSVKRVSQAVHLGRYFQLVDQQERKLIEPIPAVSAVKHDLELFVEEKKGEKLVSIFFLREGKEQSSLWPI